MDYVAVKSIARCAIDRAVRVALEFSEPAVLHLAAAAHFIPVARRD
ncbi:hypothetical protein [Actinomadura latina]|uniref:Uncharacterized protein n=1 Tax=Actinomadura latina TaxID=163603 RepID=A0A846ZA03_9ACTN|nr:hypothetical protein [Actinomadura latina]NKZ07233.1 hypothetical protein [Actinomadura latina]